MRNLTGWVVAFLFAVATGIASASAAPMVASDMAAPATSGQGGVPAPKGRLKFKSSGPVCMCAEGLSEKDIEQAMSKAKSARSSDSNSGSGHIQANTQDKPINLGVVK